MRPTVVTVLGILNIVFGSLGIFWTLISMVLLKTEFYRKVAANNPVTDMMERSPQFQTYSSVAAIVGLVAAVMVIIAGIGLLKLRPWGRQLSLGYAVVAIITVIVNNIMMFAFILMPILNQPNLSPEHRIAAISGVFSGVMGAVVGMIYPIVLLVFLTRKPVAAAFRHDQQSLSGSTLETGNPYQPPR